MNSLIVCFNALAPVFIIIAAGYAAKRVGIIREEEVARINALCFKVFQPMMCFNNLYTSDLSSAFRPKLIAFGVIGYRRSIHLRGRAIAGIAIGAAVLLISMTLSVCVTMLMPYMEDLNRMMESYLTEPSSA